MHRHPCTEYFRSLILMALLMTTLSGALTLGHRAYAEAAEDAVFAAAETLLRAEFGDLGDPVEIELMPTRHDLAACEAPSAFLNNARVSRSGRIFVGIRCGGSRGRTLYLQASLTIRGEYLVATREIPSGTVLQEDMLTRKKGDITALVDIAALSPAEVLGRVAQRRIPGGSAIKKRGLKTFQLVARGQAVFFDIVGRGFRISGKGEALQGGNPGDVIEIRTDARRTLAGTLSQQGTVRVAL